MKTFIHSHGHECWQTTTLALRYQELLDMLGDDLSRLEPAVQTFLSLYKRLLAFLSTSAGISLIESLVLLAQWNILNDIQRIQSGQTSFSILHVINFLGPPFQRGPGENGYTKIFIGGKRYRICRLRREILRRNTSRNPSDVPVSVVTVAISYKHYWENKKERIGRTDLEAIASFIEASRHAQIRFWVDTKLPPTTDGSFERWLKRGLRPYSRYLTLICPSASASQDRFWIANEKYIATAGRGIFYFRQDDILFDKRYENFNTLAKHLLRLVIGGEKPPPGVNEEDEQKMYQWALGILGSEGNETSPETCPWVSELYVDDFREHCAINRIQDVIREHGQQVLPLVPGRTWNKQNPLMIGCDGEQKRQMLGWIGLVHPNDKRNLYFLHIFLLSQLHEPSLVVLRVRLSKAYVEQENSIQEKVIMMIDTKTLREMLAVTVPFTCDWKVFSGMQ